MTDERKTETMTDKQKAHTEQPTCLCGIPNCKGHEIDEDGHVYIPNHPLGKKSPAKG